MTRRGIVYRFVTEEHGALGDGVACRIVTEEPDTDQETDRLLGQKKGSGDDQTAGHDQVRVANLESNRSFAPLTRS